jgi:hypothetical protein
VETAYPSALFENKECFVEGIMKYIFIMAQFVNESIGVDVRNFIGCSAWKKGKRRGRI